MALDGRLEDVSHQPGQLGFLAVILPHLAEQVDERISAAVASGQEFHPEDYPDGEVVPGLEVRLPPPAYQGF